MKNKEKHSDVISSVKKNILFIVASVENVIVLVDAYFDFSHVFILAHKSVKSSAFNNFVLWIKIFWIDV